MNAVFNVYCNEGCFLDVVLLILHYSNVSRHHAIRKYVYQKWVYEVLIDSDISLNDVDIRTGIAKLKSGIILKLIFMLGRMVRRIARLRI